MNRASLLDSFLSPGVFRLLLASAVVIHHAHLFALGHWAVYVFFILSGYWVGLMWSEKYRLCRKPYLTFIASRLWRLLPLYLACVAMSAAVLVRFSSEGAGVLALLQSPEWLARALVLVGSASQKLVLPPTWSLDVEMQFYIVAPLAIAIVGAGFKWRPAAVWLGTAVIAAATGVAAVALDVAHIGRFFGFFLIGLVLYRTGWNPGRRAGCAVLGVLVIVSVVLFALPATSGWIGPAATRGPVLANHILSVVFALLIVPYVAFSVHVPSSRLDRHLGNIAYPLYLFHYVAKQFVESALHRLSPGSLSFFAVDLALVAGGVLALYFFVDMPVDKRRVRFVNARRG